MRRKLLVLLVALPASNCASPPRDCVQAKQGMGKCLTDYGNKAFAAFVTDCLPPVPQKRFSGVLVFDFEYSQFFSGERSVPTDAWNSASRPMLEFSKSPSPPEQLYKAGKASITRFDFVGRRVPCDELAAGAGIIVVDEIVSSQVLRAIPSPWQNPK